MEIPCILFYQNIIHMHFLLFRTFYVTYVRWMDFCLLQIVITTLHPNSLQNWRTNKISQGHQSPQLRHVWGWLQVLPYVIEMKLIFYSSLAYLHVVSLSLYICSGIVGCKVSGNTSHYRCHCCSSLTFIIINYSMLVIYWWASNLS